MKRLILVGSPRTQGRSAHLAEELFETLIEEYPQDELFLVPISEIEVEPCIGCNGCKETSEVIIKDEAGKEVSTQKHRCIFDDDMQTVYDLIDDADEVILVCPVYFSGTPAPFKCLLDRLQPYYWAKARQNAKKPATLHVIGEGGDPHGYSALVSEMRSSLAVAGFKLERVLDWVGKLDANGEILANAEEFLTGGESQQASVPKDKSSSSAHEDENANAYEGSKKNKPKRAQLDLHAGQRGCSSLSHSQERDNGDVAHCPKDRNSTPRGAGKGSGKNANKSVRKSTSKNTRKNEGKGTRRG